MSFCRFLQSVTLHFKNINISSMESGVRHARTVWTHNKSTLGKNALDWSRWRWHTQNTLEEWSQQRKLLKFIKFTQWQHIWIKIRLLDLVELVPTVAPVDWQCWYLSADQQLLIYSAQRDHGSSWLVVPRPRLARPRTWLIRPRPLLIVLKARPRPRTNIPRDIPVLDYPGPPGKWLLKWTERWRKVGAHENPFDVSWNKMYCLVNEGVFFLLLYTVLVANPTVTYLLKIEISFSIRNASFGLLATEGWWDA